VTRVHPCVSLVGLIFSIVICGAAFAPLFFETLTMRVSHLAPQWRCSSDWPAVAEVRKVIPARKDPPVRRAMQVRSVRPVLLARPGHRAKKARPVRQARVSGSSDQTAFPGCSVQCQDNEVLITAYCGPTRNQAQFVGERGASCGPVPSAANTPLVAICVGAPQ
jgi:hypothetical protein